MKSYEVRTYIKKRPETYKVVKIPDEITKEFCDFLKDTFDLKIKKYRVRDNPYCVGYWSEEMCYLVPSCYLLISSRMDVFIKSKATLEADYLWYLPE